MAAAAGVRIAVVGDVHNQYSHTLDTAALNALQPDMTVFVGDFANEDVEIVRTVAQCPHRKVVIMGNHDAWYGNRHCGLFAHMHTGLRICILVVATYTCIVSHPAMHTVLLLEE